MRWCFILLSNWKHEERRGETMANQFTDLGIDWSPAFMEALRQQEEKRLVDMEHGVYLCCGGMGEDVEAWFSMSRETAEVLDWDLHFRSPQRVGCAFHKDIALDAAGQSGIIQVLLHPGEENEKELAVVVPVLATWPEREEGAPGLVQLALYAETLSSGGGDVITSLDGTGLTLACGTVKAAELRSNRLGGDFWHVMLEAEGVLVDVLLERAMFYAAPRPGQGMEVRGKVTAAVEPGVLAPEGG